MEIYKLMEKVSKGQLRNGAKIKINGSEIVLTYRYVKKGNKRWFEKNGQRIDIMDFFDRDFMLIKKAEITPLYIWNEDEFNDDLWTEFDKILNPNDNPRQMIRNANVSTILTDKISPEIAKIFLTSANNIQQANDGYEFILGNNNRKYFLSNEGKLTFTPFTQEEMLDYTRESYFPAHRFNVAQGCFDAAIILMDDYKKRGYEVNNIGDVKKGDTSFGNYRDALIKTLLALSCECYLQALLVSSGAEFKKMHDLSELFSRLDDDLSARVFEDMEKNGYDIVKYQSPYLKYDTNPDLAEKFMLELARDSFAVIGARYYDSDDENIDYNFLYRFASSLRNIAMQNEKINPHIDKENQMRL